jgi:hypothetical protein
MLPGRNGVKRGCIRRRVATRLPDSETNPVSFLTSRRILVRQRLFAPMLPPNALVFDIGANHGEFTAAFLSLGARVVALEPQPDVARFLAAAFPDEVARGELVVRAQAAGAAPGTARLFPATDAGRSMSTLSRAFMDIPREARRSGARRTRSTSRW